MDTSYKLLYTPKYLVTNSKANYKLQVLNKELYFFKISINKV